MPNKEIKHPKKKKINEKTIKIVYFLIGVATTLFLIGLTELINENQEQTTEANKANITQEQCKDKIPTPEATKTINISDSRYNKRGTT